VSASSGTSAAQGRIHNFSAGPAVLPVSVLEQVRDELLDWHGTGMSVMEMSHRSAAFESIINTAEADLRSLLGIGADYTVLFMQGGATAQFWMVPLNLRAAGASADYVLTGAWSKAALKEAQRAAGKARVAASTESENFKRIPAASEWQLDPQAAYLHTTANNTIFGTEWFVDPEAPAGVPVVCDFSSDALSRPVDVNRYGLLYAGAQKNLGPAGVTLVILRTELLARVPAGLPAALDYKLAADNKSLYNTPPCVAIYVVGLVLQWLKAQGGLAAIEARNIHKAGLVYDTIDSSGGFYLGHAEPASRSRMNLTFRLPSEELEKAFVKQATAAGLDGLKGHRSVGGLRASLYNALPLASVEALVAFMRDFQRKNG
jgi:phosphoserine aminotransferase